MDKSPWENVIPAKKPVAAWDVMEQNAVDIGTSGDKPNKFGISDE
ncbi:hypothetical protein [Staphylococcus aureus]|nr:hypothetical protein [Staphylococcus aureus]